MREIKFRAWDGKTMRYSLLYHGPAPCDLLRPGYADYVFMQFTGTKDSNGKEVWEGDIMEYHHKDDEYRYRIVEWSGTGFSFYPAARPLVVGNIYENPAMVEALVCVYS